MNIAKHKKKPAKVTKKKENDVDLSQYVNDHTKLIQQAFKCLEPQLVKDMLPYSIKHLSNSEVQKMCVEEIRGMTSKGLVSMMDGVKPVHENKREPSVVSLDTISSDELEETPSFGNKKVKVEGEKSKKKKKHRKKSKEAAPSDDQNLLDLVELEARARAIRAQLKKCPDFSGDIKISE